MTLFYTPTLPAHWVAQDAQGALCLLDTARGAWQRRRPYTGPSTALRPVQPALAGRIALTLAGAPTGA